MPLTIAQDWRNESFSAVPNGSPGNVVRSVRAGPRTTRRPARSTVTVIGRPFEDAIFVGISSGETDVPSTATILSPVRSPIRCAGWSARTATTLPDGASENPSRYAVDDIVKAPVKSAIATAMFIAGPARMIATRFHVRWRQYASV